jgi:hypothetical protein
MWDQNDLNGYIYETKNNRGQVKPTDILSQYIKKYCTNIQNKNFLEIGTWNGLGSTKVFVDNLIERTDKDWKFYSLESNKDKSEDAKRYYINIPNVFILNEVIWNELPSDFYEIFPEILLNSNYNYWNKIDIENMILCKKFLDRNDLPEYFDLILFDGGEFTTYHEFHFLKKYARTIILDDTNTEKCKKIAEEIRSSNEWKIIADILFDRNGVLVAEKII